MLITIFVLSILIGLICVANAENNQLEFLQNLFHEYFPDYSYEDSYLQYDETVIFIGRKPEGVLVLLCGANEEEDGWEWVESTPLPEGTRIGDENITDAVNMNAWRGGFSEPMHGAISQQSTGRRFPRKSILTEKQKKKETRGSAHM